MRQSRISQVRNRPRIEVDKRIAISQFATESQINHAASISHLDRCSLLQRLTGEGVRMTAQRRTLIEIIQESPDHLDAESLLRLAKARDSHIHRATVYRTLDLLKRMQIVDELDLMHLDGEKHFYEARVKSEHFHLACFTCGKIVEHNTP